jgi:hypothetical protein
VSDFEIRQLDRIYGAAEDRDPSGRCPNCTCKLIVARGIAGSAEYFKYPTCPNCGLEAVEAH